MPRYLWELHRKRKKCLRRQETEKDVGAVALVSSEEMASWKSDRDALIMSVSHCWETREHPDPCGHQLEQIANCTSLYHAAHGVPVWVFYDYVSLFQFVRNDEQERAYQDAMSDMHLFYTHEMSYTLRVETLTPESEWQRCLDEEIQVFYQPQDDKEGQVQAVKLSKLLRHPPTYQKRGWCQAELEFSSCRSETARNQLIDASIVQGECGTGSPDTKGKVPARPADFAARMGELIFTWRDEDLLKVQKMQARNLGNYRFPLRCQKCEAACTRLFFDSICWRRRRSIRRRLSNAKQRSLGICQPQKCWLWHVLCQILQS